MDMKTSQNPFFEEFDTLHGTAPFSRINSSHYEEAVDRGIKLAQEEIDAITGQKSSPTFENTIVALENTGKDLTRVLNVFFPMMSALSDDKLMEISLPISMKLSEYSTNLILNRKLWNRIKKVHDNFSSAKKEHDTEDAMLLKHPYETFALSGAGLKGKDREEFRKLSAELSKLTVIFGQNLLKDLNACQVWLSKEDLSGLPESSVEAAALAAKEQGREGEYLFTLEQPVYLAFMKHSSRRDLRERMYRLYSGRNIRGNYSNVEIVKRIAEIRLRIANLLGSKTYAEHSLKRSMAETPERVYDLLERLRKAYRPAQLKEFSCIEDFAKKIDGPRIGTIMPWDYSYYSNKLKNEEFSFNDEELRPYFELGNVIKGVFSLATKLYELEFKENPLIETYHPDVKAFEVTDSSSGRYIGVLYADFFPRENKQPGGWTTGFKDQHIAENGEDVRPHLSIVMNFTRPTSDKPSLLTPYEVGTFLHEFGHALHGLLADTKYATLSGTSVYRDFVELPSQFNENYLTQKQFLDGFARHYKTGEPMPQQLIDKFVASSRFGVAYACMRQLSFGYLDMAWHTITSP